MSLLRQWMRERKSQAITSLQGWRIETELDLVNGMTQILLGSTGTLYSTFMFRDAFRLKKIVSIWTLSK